METIKKNPWRIEKTKNQNSTEINLLTFDQVPVPCIYKNPVMLPHPRIQGQVIIENPLCGSHCPMFQLFGDKLTFGCTKVNISVINEEKTIL